MEKIDVKRSIKRKIMLLIIAIVFLLSFLLSFLVGNIAKNELQVDAGKSLLGLSKRIADILDREMYERFREIGIIATLPEFTNLDTPNSQRRELLQKLKKDFEHHAWIGFAGVDGTVLTGSDGYLEGKNASARPWHSAGLKGPYIGDVHDALLLARLLPNPSGEYIYLYDVAHPVKNIKGETIGVLCSHLYWQWTREILRTIEKENDIEIYLLSKDNMILAGPNNSERKMLKEYSQEIDSFVNENKNAYKNFKWYGSNEYVTALTISEGFKEYKGFGWKVLIRQNTNNAFESANEIQNKIIIYGLAIGFIFLAIGSLFATRIVLPLMMLTDGVKKVSKGSSVEAIPEIKTGDEIEYLSLSLREMVVTLKDEIRQKESAQEKVALSATVFEESSEGIIITDKDNKIITVNKSFCKTSGYKKEEVYGVNPKVLGSGHHSKDFYDKMWNEIIKVGKWEGKIINKAKDGTTYAEILTIKAVKNSDGDVTNYIAVFTDIEKMKNILEMI